MCINGLLKSDLLYKIIMNTTNYNVESYYDCRTIKSVLSGLFV